MALNLSNELPDAFFMPNAFLAQARSLDITVDGRDYMSEEFKASVPQSIMDATVIDGRQMIFPWFILPQALIYRSDWLADSGLGPIDTMDDFLATAQAFTTDDGQWGFNMFGSTVSYAVNRFSNYVRVWGVEIVAQDENGKWYMDITSDKYRNALQFFVDLDLVHGVVPPGATEVEYADAVAYFANGQTGLFLSGPNAIGAILKANPDLEGKIASAPIPMAETYNTDLTCSGYAITAACEHPKEMAMYLEYAADPVNSVSFGEATGRLPVVKEALDDDAFQVAEYQGFIDSIDIATPYPQSEYLAEILSIMAESYNSMLSGVSLEDATDQVEKRVSTIDFS